MDIHQEILKNWRGIQDADGEREAFDKYTEAREKFLEGLKKSATGSINQTDLENLSNIEKGTFLEYLKHRIKLKS